MTEPTEESKAKFQLSDIFVKTVGLVPKGANKQDFFLLKSIEEVDMPDENTNIEEVNAEKEKSPSLLDQVKETLKKEFEAFKSSNTPPEKAAKEQETPVEVATQKEDAPVLDALKATQEAHLAAMEKAHKEQIELMKQQMENQYKSQIESLADRVEKAEARTQAADEARAKQVMLEKASEFRAFPTTYAELGDKLYKLSTVLEPEDFQWWEATLKAADQQLWTAGVFAEMGTSRSPEIITLEDKVVKAQKEEGKSAAEALTSLSVSEQRQLLAEIRGGA